MEPLEERVSKLQLTVSHPLPLRVRLRLRLPVYKHVMLTYDCSTDLILRVSI